MNPNLPLTPVEQGIAAAEAIEAGASMIHLHVRNDDGTRKPRAGSLSRSRLSDSKAGP